MTRVLAIEADKVIIVACDGLAVDEHGNPTSTKEVKIFQLSPRCVVMPAGWLPENIGETFEQIRKLNSEQDRLNVYEIAQFLVKEFTLAEKHVSWLRQDTLMFSVAGYEKRENGISIPLLLVLFRKDDRWQVNLPVRKDVIASGEGFERTIDYVAHEIDAIAGKVSGAEAIDIAKQAILKASNDHKGAIGGTTTIWQVTPSEGVIK